MTTLETIIYTLTGYVTEGVSGLDLEAQAVSLLALYKVEPAFLGYQPKGFQSKYPNILCVSINGEVIHGIPDDRKFQDGDVVKIDCGIKEGDQYDDGAATVVIGRGSAAVRRLIKGTQEALEAGIAAAKPGATTNDIGAAIEAVAKKYELAIIEGYGGHGIGTELHMEPFIPNEIVPMPRPRKKEPEQASTAPLGLVVGDSVPKHKKYVTSSEPEIEYETPEGVELKKGMRIAIEPMFSTNRAVTGIMSNGWTVKIIGGGIAAHFEKTITV